MAKASAKRIGQVNHVPMKKHGACGLFHSPGFCPDDPAVIEARSRRFADIKADGGAFRGVVREDGRWHRRWPGLLIKAGSPYQCRRVGLLGWLFGTPRIG